jgi:50S ribosomal protein L16 3-hydroxylase
MPSVPRSSHNRKQTTAGSPFLGGLTPQDFLSEFWQKKPLLVRGAVPQYTPPISSEELAGLACEDEVESRVVVFDGSTWQLEQGPFKARSFPKRGAKNWTLLVQDLDEHVPAVASLLSHLNFLPRFRIDDIMASFAAPGGSVGPHFDEYDVFLLQVEGTRRWQVSDDFDRAALRTDSQLKILRDFHPKHEWVVEPGDLLYLPPHVAHFGVALTPCMTFSLGCRAPSHSDLVAQMAGMILSELDESRRYTDKDLGVVESSSGISAEATNRVSTLMNEVWKVTPDLAARCLGAVTTQPKLVFRQDDEDMALSDVETRRVLKSKRSLYRRKGSRWSWYQGEATYLFVDGREFALGGATKAWAACLSFLCENRVVSLDWRQQQDEPRAALIAELVRRGQLQLEE